MAIWSRKHNLGAAVEDWASRGLIDAPTKARLQEDLGSSAKKLSFSAFVILAGVICLGFGAISFVAANWDEIPRIARAFGIFVAMWAAWGGAFWAASRAKAWAFECLVLLASILYGAAIMLIAQLYHIQGPAEAAVMMWAIGTLVGAVLTRSGLAMALVFILLAIWHGMLIGDRFENINPGYLVWLAIASVATWWVRSRFSAHLAAMSLVFWGFTALAILEMEPTYLAMASGATMSILILAFLSNHGPRVLRGFESGLVTYGVLFFGLLTLVLLGLSDVGYRDEMVAPNWVIIYALPALVLAGLSDWLKIDTRYDAWIATAMCAGFTVAFSLYPNPWLQSAFALAVFIWVPRLGWRLESTAIRVLGMIGFAVAMLIVYAVTVGSLIGTSGFYLGAGVILLAGAWIGNRLGRSKPEGET